MSEEAVTPVAAGAPGASAGEPAAGVDPSMGPQPPSWPMTVNDFLAGPYLEPADVLLMRERNSWFARLVQLFTGSYFSKAATVFLAAHREPDFTRTFTMEAGFRGVDLTDLESFAAHKQRKYVIAIKRLEVPWFEQDERNMVRGYLLSHIRAEYDFGRLFDNLWSSLGRSRFVFLRLFLGPQRALRWVLKSKKTVKLNRFIGPGLVQWGYYQATRQLIETGYLAPERIEDVIFTDRALNERPHDGGAINEEYLLSLTAEEMATSARLAWKYAIIDGRVQPIDSAEAFYALADASRLRRRRARRTVHRLLSLNKKSS
jgi:hypothetical protein